jgi:dolichyl-phosphate-mannose-protein mannosyltransferase
MWEQLFSEGRCAMTEEMLVNSALGDSVGAEPAGFAAARAGWPWALLMAVLFCVMAWQNLGFPPKPVFDEIYTVTAAQEYVEGMPVHEQSHPPLSKLIMAAGYLGVLGGRYQDATPEWSPVAYAVRVPGVLTAGVCLMLIYALGVTLFNKMGPALLATGLLALDGLFMVFARTAMTNIYGLCFLLLGTLGTSLAIKRRNPHWLLLAGLGFGLAMASRWTAAVGFGLNGAVVLGCLVVLARSEAGWDKHRVFEWLAGISLGFVVLPVLIYFLSYVPQVMAVSHHQPRLWPAIRYIVALQGAIVNMHTTGGLAPHPAESAWWTWPLMLKPVWFYAERVNGFGRVVFAVGNAAIWWASVPVMLYGTYQALVKRSAPHALATLLAAGLWLVWAVVGARETWMHYFFESIPFVCLLLGALLWEQVEKVRADGPLAMPRAIALVIYASAAIGWSAWFYPLETARPITEPYYEAHMLLGDHNWEKETVFDDYLKKYDLQDPKKFKAFAARNFPNPEQYLQILERFDDIKARNLRAIKGIPMSPRPSSRASAGAGQATDASPRP